MPEAQPARSPRLQGSLPGAFLSPSSDLGRVLVPASFPASRLAVLWAFALVAGGVSSGITLAIPAAPTGLCGCRRPATYTVGTGSPVPETKKGPPQHTACHGGPVGRGRVSQCAVDVLRARRPS